MDNITLSIGRRLKQLRKAKDMTQQELELAIGASFGHISRIESDQINPSKETLLKISEKLNLNIKEKLILLGLNLEPVTQPEVQNCLDHCQNYFSSTQNPVYLADDFWYTWMGNDSVFRIVGAPEEESARKKFIEQRKGTHILEWLFDNQLGVRQKMPPERWEDIAVNQCVYFIGLIDYFSRVGQPWLEILCHKLYQLPDFERIWNRAKTEAGRDPERRELSVTYIYNGDWYEFFIANSRINTLPRFMMVEYIPAAVYRNGRIKETIEV